MFCCSAPASWFLYSYSYNRAFNTSAAGTAVTSRLRFPLPVQERIICLHGPITEQMSSLVTAQLLFLESEDPERPINMYINRFVSFNSA